MRREGERTKHTEFLLMGVFEDAYKQTVYKHTAMPRPFLWFSLCVPPLHAMNTRISGLYSRERRSPSLRPRVACLIVIVCRVTHIKRGEVPHPLNATETYRLGTIGSGRALSPSSPPFSIVALFMTPSPSGRASYFRGACFLLSSSSI